MFNKINIPKAQNLLHALDKKPCTCKQDIDESESLYKNDHLLDKIADPLKMVIDAQVAHCPYWIMQENPQFLEKTQKEIFYMRSYISEEMNTHLDNYLKKE